MKEWQCTVCGFVYEEAEGIPDEGIEPDTTWDEIPADWKCPGCDAPKDDFEMIEVE